MLHTHIVSDIKKCNSGSRHVALNKTLQNFMFKMLEDNSEIAQKMSVQVMIELYNKNIWNEAKTVNLIAQACLGTGKVVLPALKFFIEPVEGYDSDEEQDNSAQIKQIKIKMKNMHSKKTKGRLNKFEKEIRKAKKGTTEKNKGKALPAIEQIHDPSSFANKLFKNAKTSNQSFDIRLMMLNLVARVIKVHKLIMPNFYPFLQKYLDTKQTSINYILVILIQACHELVNPDILTPLLRTIVNKFVCEYNPGPIIAIGLNTVREICIRCPLSMSQEMLRDITQFKSFSKDKGVVAASRGIINLFRKVHPALLNKKDRGKEGQMSVKQRIPLAYAVTTISSRVEGAALLEKAEYMEQIEQQQKEEEEEEEGNEEEEEGNEEDLKDGVEEEQEEEGNGDAIEGGEVEGEVEGEFEEVGGEFEEEGDSGREEQGEEEEESKSVSSEDEYYHDPEDKKWNMGEEGEEEGGEGEGVDEEAPPLKKPRNQLLEAVRFLGDEDFERIDSLKSSGLDQLSSDEEEGGPIKFVSETDIESYTAKKTRDQEERKQFFKSIQQELRQGRGKKQKTSGLSNKEKKKTKPWVIAKQSKRIKGKIFSKLSDKQRNQREGNERSEKKKRKRRFLR